MVGNQSMAHIIIKPFSFLGRSSPIAWNPEVVRNRQQCIWLYSIRFDANLHMYVHVWYFNKLINPGFLYSNVYWCGVNCPRFKATWGRVSKGM